MIRSYHPFYFALVMTAAVLCPPVLMADVVELNGGQRITGTVTEKNNERVIIEVDGLPVTIMLKDVAEIRLGEAPATETTNDTAPAEPETVTGDADDADQPGDRVETAGTDESAATELPFLPMLPVVLPPGRTFHVTSSSLRLRKGPGTDYEIVTNLYRKQLLVEIENSSGWLHGRTMSGETGWVSMDYVEPLLNIPIMVNVRSTLNIREEPGQYYRSFGRVRKGQVGILLEEGDSWCKAQFGLDLVGWCKNDYLIKLEDMQVVRPPLKKSAEQVAPYVTQSGNGSQLIFDVARDELVINGLTRIVAFVTDTSLLESPDTVWNGESVLKIETLDSQDRLLGAGFEKRVFENAKGAAVILVKGYRETPVWRYTLNGPSRSVHYAFIAQSGEKRGEVFVCK